MSFEDILEDTVSKPKLDTLLIDTLQRILSPTRKEFKQMLKVEDSLIIYTYTKEKI